MKNEVILMKTATYGRMRIGRCITAKEVDALGPLVGQDARYLGCSANVLDVLDRKCSGSSECEIRVADMSQESVTPCFPGLMVYLEVSYECINGQCSSIIIFPFVVLSYSGVLFYFVKIELLMSTCPLYNI